MKDRISLQLIDSIPHARTIVSICSAHPIVIEAAIVHAAVEHRPTLLEATCNQVNQDGGYTGLTPQRFRDLAFATSKRLGFPSELIVLGGDHLGPSPWRHLPAEAALAQAAIMVAAYVAAGFEKIHLDTSMGCRDEPISLPDSVVAMRAAHLAAVAERTAAANGTSVRYVIGSEVPTPGGAIADPHGLHVTTPENAVATFRAHEQAFADVGVEAAFDRVIGLVVQPGVEFGPHAVNLYQSERAFPLRGVLNQLSGVAFEVHSTDYQSPDCLVALAQDGFVNDRENSPVAIVRIPHPRLGG